MREAIKKTTKREEILKAIEGAFDIIAGVFSIFLYGIIFSLAGFFLINHINNFYYLVGAMGILFYSFSILMVQPWISLIKILNGTQKKEANN